jgi:hypothetical protein
MIRTRLAGALVAGALAVGLVAGAAGTSIAKDSGPSATDVAACAESVGDMRSMMSGQGGMMSGSGTVSAMPDWMWQHHPTAIPGPAR